MPDKLEIPPRGPRVFISYSFANPRVAAFRDSLQQRGFRPTVVEAATLLGSPSLTEAISGLIRGADCVIPLVDAAAATSNWVRKELELALAYRVPIIPVLEPGVDPAVLFADVPCVLGMDADAVARSLLQNYVCLNFDRDYPAHIEFGALVDVMRTAKPGILDLDQNLTKTIARVAGRLFAHEHAGLTEQTLRQWRDFQAAMDELDALVPAYRAALRPFLDGWGEPERASVASWNPLTRLILGTRLMRFVESWPPRDTTGWEDFSPGAARMLEEWTAVPEEDPLLHKLLWGVGQRVLPVKDWHEAKTSPLGSWLLVSADASTGERCTIILPDSEVIAGGLRLGEPPRVYLQSWDWLYFVLPQLAYHGVALSPELGPNLLKRCRLA